MYDPVQGVGYASQYGAFQASSNRAMYNAGNYGSADNVRLDASYILTARAVNTVRIGTAIDMIMADQNQTLTLGAGGLLTSVNGAVNFWNGKLTAGNGSAATDLIIGVNGNNATNIYGRIVDNGTSNPVTLVKALGSTAAQSQNGVLDFTQAALTAPLRLHPGAQTYFEERNAAGGSGSTN